MEAGHTYQLLRAGAENVVAIEANTFSYVKCLIVKELLKLDRASFLLGDFVLWLESSLRRADILWASGVLYHMVDPIRFIELISESSNNIFIWTHYIDEEEMPETDPRRSFITDFRTIDWRGHRFVLYERRYGSEKDSSFMGGVHPNPSWMRRNDILIMLAELGYDEINILPGDNSHVQGPNFSLLARRSCK